MWLHLAIASVFTIIASWFGTPPTNHATLNDKLVAHHPLRVKPNVSTSPQGLTIEQMRAAYGFGASGGTGSTIAIIDAYDYPTAASDLNVFSQRVLHTSGFPSCSSTVTTSCFAKHKMGTVNRNSGWALEAALDTQWAHAVGPGAKILLVEAKSNSLSNLLSAIDYARAQPDVVAVSMSWGASEFASETSFDSHFTSTANPAMRFFASSGDSGHGVEWPAVSPDVIGVGGTTLTLSGTTVTGETAWAGSGGGVSAYEPRPGYQAGRTPFTSRAVPDVAYNADPDTGVPVYDTTSYNGQTGWWVVGGTSAGAPQWAALRALSSTIQASTLYQDLAGSYNAYFRDITTGSNGTCGSTCTASSGYDAVTGIGSPRSPVF